MTVAPWEIWSVANMMISAHGADAEAVVNEKINTALAANDTAQLIVWRAVADKIAQMRQERPTPGTSLH